MSARWRRPEPGPGRSPVPPPGLVRPPIPLPPGVPDDDAAPALRSDVATAPRDETPATPPDDAPATPSRLGSASATDPQSAAIPLRKRLNMLLGKRKRTLGAMSIFSVLAGLVESATIAVLAQLAFSIAERSGKGGSHHGVLSFLNIHASTPTLIWVGFGLCALRLVIQIPLSTLSARITADVQARLRREMFDAFNRASWSIQSRDREGHLQEVMSSQIMQAIGAVTGTVGLINASFQFLVLMGTALALNWIAAISAGTLSLAMFLTMRPLRHAGGRASMALSRAQFAYAGGIAESNRLAEESHVFGAGRAQRASINRLIAESRRHFYRSQLIMRMVTNFYQVVVYILLISGIGVLYLTGSKHAASLTAVILLLVRAGQTGQAVQGSYQSLVQAGPFVARIQEILANYRRNAESYGNEPLQEISALEFRHVSFAYTPDKPTLSDVGFAVTGGEAIGIVGPSGAGKSTVVQLLLRLRDPGSGEYLVNGRPAAGYRSADWHKEVSYVPQNPELLHASVADNIRFFRDIPLEEVERAARLARIHDDIASWGGYDAIVGPRADAVSGGQEQRICLARALASRPSMLVLDEPTSALDPQSESLISESLHTIRNELTLFIVAHRISTLEMCDRVMVIEGGRLVAIDTRDELHRSNTYFRNASQLTIAAQAAQSGHGA